MEPQDVNATQPEQTTSVDITPSQPTTEPTPATEAEKPVPLESPVILNWKRPIITMVIIGVIAVVIMLLAKNL